MNSATIRRSITASDPRSPLQLTTLATSFPQHQLISGFQTLQVSPQYSPTKFSHPPPNTPVYARSDFPEQYSKPPQRLVKRRRTSSLAKLLGPRNVPGWCSCGYGRKSVKHMIRDCP